MSGPTRANATMWELYRGEVETHAKALTDGLLAFERDGDPERLAGLMRAAHSIKGAARIVRHLVVADVAHALEDRLVAAQHAGEPLTPEAIQTLIDAVDLIGRLSPAQEAGKDAAADATRDEIDRLLPGLATPGEHGADPSPPRAAVARPTTVPPVAIAEAPRDVDVRALRLTAQTVTRMLALAGQTVVGQRWFEPFAASLGALKRQVSEAANEVEHLVDGMAAGADPETARRMAFDIQHRLEQAHGAFTHLVATLDEHALRQDVLASRLYREIQTTRLRPFADLVEPFPRLVRDLARQLGKQVDLTIEGARTDVDRDMASALESPLIHAIRNAVDHGIEAPADRVAAGKPEAGRLVLAAGHRAGMLRIDVTDDGRGIDLDVVRRRVIELGLADAALAARFEEQELLAFLFLPQFTTAAHVSDVSGRGVGLDAVNEAVKSVGGQVRILNRPGHGMTLRFDVPVTLSLQQVLIVEVDGEPYALPVTRVERVEQVPRESIHVIEGREYVSLTLSTLAPVDAAVAPDASPDHVGLVNARQLFEVSDTAMPGDVVSVVVLRERDALYGLAVDRLLGDRTIVVRPLDPRLGKVRNIAAAGLSDEGALLLVIDVDDLVRSIDEVLKGGRLARIDQRAAPAPAVRRRILVVDDSITVREVERQSLESHGYEVDVAVDGIDGWNALRGGPYDLVVTDVDMPRLDGIGLVERIRADHRLSNLPVMIVSYKDREEDRLRGLAAGASYYLPKASFQDETFLRAVDELIGGEA